MKKTIFGFVFGMIMICAATSCGNKCDNSTSIDTTLVDSVDTVTTDTVSVDSIAK